MQHLSLFEDLGITRDVLVSLPVLPFNGTRLHDDCQENSAVLMHTSLDSSTSASCMTGMCSEHTSNLIEQAAANLKTMLLKNIIGLQQSAVCSNSGLVDFVLATTLHALGIDLQHSHLRQEAGSTADHHSGFIKDLTRDVKLLLGCLDLQAQDVSATQYHDLDEVESISAVMGNLQSAVDHSLYFESIASSIPNVVAAVKDCQAIFTSPYLPPIFSTSFTSEAGDRRGRSEPTWTNCHSSSAIFSNDAIHISVNCAERVIEEIVGRVNLKRARRTDHTAAAPYPDPSAVESELCGIVDEIKKIHAIFCT